MKKRLLSLTACLLVVAMIFSGCGGPSQDSQAEGTSSTGQSEAAAEPSTEKGENWVADEVVKLKFWAMREDTVQDLNTNAYIKWLEQECGVDIEFEQASSAEALQKLNLSLASGSYPDVYYSLQQVQGITSHIINSTLMKYGQAGIFIPLNDLIEEYGTNTKQLFEDVDYLKNGITMPDGNIYALPSYSEIYHCRYSQKMWIDQSWLDNLGLEMPTTTDEFYEVLKAFKEQDPNQNGEADEIPLAGCLNAWHSDPYAFLMNSFIYDEGDKHFTVTDGEVDTILDKEEYREGLRYVSKLYEEGLIYSETYTQDATQLKSITSLSPNRVGAFTVGAPMGVVDGNAELYKNIVVVPPLKGPEGVQYAGYYKYQDLRIGGYVITSACENPEAAFKLGDFMYTPDSSIRLRQGEYKVDWKMAEEGQKTFDGKDAEYARITPLVTDGDPQNQHMGNTGLFRESNDSFIGLWAVKDDFDIRSMDGIEQLLIEQTWPYEGYEPDETLPPVVFTEEEASELNTIETEVKKYCDEQRTLFITGQRDLDADWDDYVSNLKDLGIDRLVEGYNTAYARQYLE